ncbi:MAG: outer membrane protein assembly factor BamB family protein, partial [Planctomycetota bacterium]
MQQHYTAVVLACLVALPASADDWPQWRGPTRDGVWRESGLRESLPEGQMPLVWRAAIGSGYSGPTVADGRVYVSDRVSDDDLERVHCFDAKTGAVLWTHAYECSYAEISYEAGPRCSVLISDGLAYSLGAVGNLVAFDAATGDVKFSRDLRAEYDIQMPIWGITASPLVEGDLLIVPVSGKDAWIVAFDRTTGAERWRMGSDRGNYSSPIVIDQAGKRVLVCWSGDRVVAADPETGAVRWEHPFEARNMPLGVATPIHDGRRMFLTGFYDGCMLLELGQDAMGVKQLWRRVGPNEIRTDGLQSIISTPLMLGDYVYGVDSYGQLRCLDLANGDRVWEDLTAVPKARWATIHMVQNGQTTWMFNER